MTDDDRPDEATLLELGRLTWAAIVLEDVVYGVCRAINNRYGPFDEPPIGTRVGEALLDLRSMLAGPHTLRATDWLTEAKSALEERNAVVHAVPVTTFPLPGTTPIPDVPTDWLTHFPRRNKRPIVHTAMIAQGLAPTTRRLETALAGWTEIVMGPWEKPASGPDSQGSS
jgi:hypothetical protein